MRLAEVHRVRTVTPQLISVMLRGPDLADFNSGSFDDHIKLLLPQPNHPLLLPAFGPDGPIAQAAESLRPIARDYTPRRFDNARAELELEFAMHGVGPADDWAQQARPGQQVGIGGPRGSRVVSMAFDWHLLIGDDTALPAIARRLEELPARARALVIVEVDGPDCIPPFQSSATVEFTSLFRRSNSPRDLAQGVREMKLPAGEGYAWAAGEAAQIAGVRRELVAVHGLDKSRIRAAAYWKRGAIAHHSQLEE
jgi:NADPH-dependent ferric siderophore reductase